MSIAITVVVHPSKIGRSCAILSALLLVLIGIYVVCLESMSVLIRCVLVSLICLVAWFGILTHRKLARTHWFIAVDGQGQLRGQPSTSLPHSPLNALQDPPPLLNLTAGTTLWARALFLCLHRPEDGANINLVVLPDSLGRDEFRRLSIACRWIVAHKK